MLIALLIAALLALGITFAILSERKVRADEAWWEKVIEPPAHVTEGLRRMREKKENDAG